MRKSFMYVAVVFVGLYSGRLVAYQQYCSSPTCATCNHSLDGTPLGSLASHQCFKTCYCVDGGQSYQSCRIERCNGCGGGSTVYASRCQSNLAACELNTAVACAGLC